MLQGPFLSFPMRLVPCLTSSLPSESLPCPSLASLASSFCYCWLVTLRRHRHKGETMRLCVRRPLRTEREWAVEERRHRRCRAPDCHRQRVLPPLPSSDLRGVGVRRDRENQGVILGPAFRGILRRRPSMGGLGGSLRQGQRMPRIVFASARRVGRSNRRPPAQRAPHFSSSGSALSFSR